MRAFLVLVLLAALGFALYSYWPGTPLVRAPQPIDATGTAGTIDTERARQRGAEIGEKAGEAAAKVQESITEAQITAKIKAKMALDDSVKARTIDVSTTGATVTLEGTVGSAAEHKRAIALARDTKGVDRVIDRLQVR